MAFSIICGSFMRTENRNTSLMWKQLQTTDTVRWMIQAEAFLAQRCYLSHNKSIGWSLVTIFVLCTTNSWFSLQFNFKLNSTKPLALLYPLFSQSAAITNLPPNIWAKSYNSSRWKRCGCSQSSFLIRTKITRISSCGTKHSYRGGTLLGCDVRWCGGWRRSCCFEWQ